MTPSRVRGPDGTIVRRLLPGSALAWVGMASVLLLPALAAAQPQPVKPPPTPPAPSQEAPAAESPAPSPQAGAVPAPAQAAPAAQALTFPTPSGALLMSVRQDRTAEFESLMALFDEALAASGDESAKALAAGWSVFRAGEPAPGGANVLYVVVIDPVRPDADYSWQAILSTIVAAFPDKQQEVFEKGTSVHAGPMNKLTLTRLGAAR